MANTTLGRSATGGLDSMSGFRKSGLQSGLSTQIKILAQNTDDSGSPTGTAQVIGAIQSLQPTETRTLIRINEVGTDGVIEIVPQQSATCELTVTRIVFDYQRLPAAFQRGFRHIHAARLPFDIVVEDYNAYQEMVPGGGATSPSAGKTQENTSNFVTTTYKNCWITSYSYQYQQDNFLISENATIWAEHVFDGPTWNTNISTGASDTLETFANSSNNANAMSAAAASVNRTSSGS